MNGGIESGMFQLAGGLSFLPRSGVDYSSEVVDILRLIRSENVGIRSFYSLVKMFGSAGKALQKIQDMSLKGGKSKPIKLFSKNDIEKELEALDKAGARLLTYLDKDYPPLLKHISDAPPVISYLGNKKLFGSTFCAIVGARNSSFNGQNFASSISKNLVSEGFFTVSGLARGIDTAVHKSSLPNTVAIIAGGIDHIYPPENTKLFHEIADQGAIIAELPIGSVPLGKHFPQRNRIISGMAMVTLVIEAGLNSGSLITARMALDQGREVCAVPGFPLDPRCQGSNKLIKEGASLIESFEDVLELLERYKSKKHDILRDNSNNDNFVPMPMFDYNVTDADRARIFDMLSSAPVSIDDISTVSCLELPVIYLVLLELELAGKATRLINGDIVRVF